MLSDEQAAILIKYLKDVKLTESQQQRLIEKYWDGSDEERKEIARAYAHLFSNKDFLQNVIDCHHRRKSEAERAATGSSCDESRQASLQRAARTQLLMRAAINDQLGKLSGPGPFVISFGVVQSEEERREVVDVFAAQFTHPDRKEIQRLVSSPQALNTRTRKRVTGSYTFFIRSHTTREMACAVTVIAHRWAHHNFVEMPLFATAAGYQRNGLARLLTAALKAWCAAASFEFIMISADVEAIPFWKHLSFSMMSQKERKSIEFFYQHECYQFKGAECMIGYCNETPGQEEGAASRKELELLVQKMTRFTVDGPISLPD